MNFSGRQFKIRCSAIGHIIGEPKLKAAKEAGELSETAKGYCEDWLKGKIFNRKLEFTNKYTEKGLIMEDASIDFLSEQLGLGMLFKDDQFLENDYMQGHMDISLPDYVFDVKNSWSWETFPLFETEVPTSGYFWQLQGYMELANKKAAKLIYVLSDTPQHLIEREARNYCFYNGFGDMDIEIYNEFYNKLTYQDVDPKLKLKVFDIPRDQQAIERIKIQVEKCRIYIDKLLTQIK
jgi:hypothetical protein